MQKHECALESSACLQVAETRTIASFSDVVQEHCFSLASVLCQPPQSDSTVTSVNEVGEFGGPQPPSLRRAHTLQATRVTLETSHGVHLMRPHSCALSVERR